MSGRENNIMNVQFYTIKPNSAIYSEVKSKPLDNSLLPKQDFKKYSSENCRAAFMPLSFKGNAPRIKRAFIISDKEDYIPLIPTKKRNSHIIEFDSQTEMIYGIDAVNYLNSTDTFEYDTQVLIPKKAHATLNVDGKTVALPENSVVLLNAGTKAKISGIKGYPAIIMSKQDFSWYERYSKNANDPNIRNKYLELMYYNSHLYNGEFSPNALLPDRIRDENFLKTLGIDKWNTKNGIVCALFEQKDKLTEDDRHLVETAKSAMDKLHANKLIKNTSNGFVELTPYYTPKYFKKVLFEKGFTQEEYDLLSPVVNRARRVRKDALFALANPASAYRDDLIPRLKEAKIFHNNKINTDKIYWRRLFPNEKLLRAKLKEAGFNQEDENSVVDSWHKTNLTGYDISGLKFISDNAAVYNLDDKINNWTQEETNWLTNSTELSNSKCSTPFLGVSCVQCDDERFHHIDELRQGETLHSHPALDDKKQSEIYMVTSGAAALTIVKNDKPEIVILEEGDLAVMGPGVKHCVNSVMGEYEQIVAQVPSSFQYGLEFKKLEPFPEGFDKKQLDIEAKEKLEQYKKEHPCENKKCANFIFRIFKSHEERRKRN